MAGERIERRLAAILAADVAGYSRLMGVDEAGTLAELKTIRREIVDPAMADYKGRIVKTTGDGLLVEFASAVDAVTCAMVVQSLMEKRDRDPPKIMFRIGINVGDIIIDDGDIFGDGVNVAARVENECEPGGVCLSGNAFEQIRGKTNFIFDDLGERPLKNIDRPVKLYSVRSPGSAPAANVPLTKSVNPLAPPDKPSIAVLPFQNMSGDPEQEYFADGIVEDIITALSRFKSLFVIARNSSFTYKGKSVDIKRVGHELGVRYVLEGSVRKAANRIRITAQLIDTSIGAHVWADKLDRQLDDIFALQDEITEAVAAIIEPSIKRVEIDRAAQNRPANLTAYDYYLRALPKYYSVTKDGFEEAIGLCSRALEMDPRYLAAARLAAQIYGLRPAQGWSIDVKADYAEALRLGRRALEIDDADPDLLANFGRGIGAWSDDYDAAKNMADRAVALNPNSAHAWSQRGWTYRYVKDSKEALSSFQRAMRLNPIDPMMFDTLTGIASTYLIEGRDEEAVSQARRAIALNPRFSSAHRCLVAALAHLGRKAEAEQAAAALLEIEPKFRIGAWANYGGHWQGQRFLDGLRLAGLPE